MKRVVYMAMFCLLFAGCTEPTLKSSFEGKFDIGVSMSVLQLAGHDPVGMKIITKQFNSITPENCMKSAVIHPSEGVYNFELADKTVDFAEANGMSVIGHELINDGLLAPWFCYDTTGTLISGDLLKERMEEYITTVMQRYKGRITTWNVVNEALDDDGNFRTDNPFYQILGEEYVALAFEYARKAYPEATLCYTDNSMTVPSRCMRVVEMINDLKARGITIDGVAVLAHWNLNYPSAKMVDKTIETLASTGVKVFISGFDLSILPANWTGLEVSTKIPYSAELDPYRNGVPDDVMKAWNKRMEEYFEVFLKHSDEIETITMWGLTDADSWTNNWPIFGRQDYPLLYDRDYKPKEVVNLYQTPNN